MASLREAARALRELPLSYAQIVFSRSPVVGLLLMAATATVPRAFLGGLLGVAAASAAALLLSLDPEARREGVFGYNALLLGLGLSQTFSGAAPFWVLILGVAPACVVLTAALRVWLQGTGLPVLSWPFLLLFSLLLHAPEASGGLLSAAHGLSGAPSFFLPAPLDLFLRGLGALFFLPHLVPGALLLLGLLWHSRIATLFAAAGFALAWLLCDRLSLPAGALLAVLGYNAAFTTMALSGVWFVPSPSSLLLGLFAVLLCVLSVVGLGLKVMVLPFNLTVTLVLLALRQRAADRRPKSVDFLPGTPEENLSYFRTRLLRFRWLHALRLRLPFRGAWLCTQGVDGTFTHKGRWRHAYDFEVRGTDGLLFQGDGSAPEHYHAFRLPVLCSAPGTVVRVVNHVPDNPVGTMNLAENWGNLVLVRHAPGLHSLVAHLACGSVKVFEGQYVRQGDLLGLCGNSGRSAQPHLHFHLQAGDLLGDGTLPCRFNDVVALHQDKAAIETACDPVPGHETRNLEPTVEGAAFLGLAPGAEWVLSGEAGEEHVVSEVDLYGRRLLRSREHGAVLYYELSEDFFTIYDVVGGPRSVLHLLRLALPRVPLEPAETLRWRDYLPARPLRSWAARVLSDFAAPFLHNDGIQVELRLHREGPLLWVSGESLVRDRKGTPILRTRAALGPSGGPVRIEVTISGHKTRRSERRDHEHDKDTAHRDVAADSSQPGQPGRPGAGTGQGGGTLPVLV